MPFSQQLTIMAVIMVIMSTGSSFIAFSAGALTDPESDVLGRVDGENIWQRGMELEGIGESSTAFRSAGSDGANLSASWIRDEFEAIGLESWYEEFEFFGWDLRSEPDMSIEFSNGTGNHTLVIPSFQAEQFSSSTGEGLEGEVVLLPLPETASYSSFQSLAFDPGFWQGIDVQGKVVLIGREVRWNRQWEGGLAEKLPEGPEALIFFYSQSWTVALEKMFMASSGGRPHSSLGTYLEDLGIPVGHLDGEDSTSLVQKMSDGVVTATVRIDSVQGRWNQSNVVARLPGTGSDGTVLITAHFDSIVGPGFCDNAASVGAMLEIASVIMDSKISGNYRPRNDLVFVAFSGEEMGLVGSSFYYMEHFGELQAIDGIINLDCLGASQMVCTETSGDDLDLDSMFQQASVDLGVEMDIGQVGSDHESFLHPQQVMDEISRLWSDVPSMPYAPVPVANSISVSSVPISPQALWTSGSAGWIHTSRDSSSYANDSSWVTVTSLEEQCAVATLVAMRVAGTVEDEKSADLLLPAMIGVGAGLLAIAAIFIWRRGKR